MRKLPAGAKKRKCCTCGEIKLFDQFHKDKYAPYGITTSCKKCRNEKCKQYYKEHPGKRTEVDRKSYQKNRLKHLMWRKRYYNNHKEHCLQYNRQHRIDNLDKAKIRRKTEYLIDSGNLLRQNKCSLCFMDGEIHAHHYDYDDPLHIIWLCSYCHARIHAELKRSRYHEYIH